MHLTFWERILVTKRFMFHSNSRSADEIKGLPISIDFRNRNKKLLHKFVESSTAKGGTITDFYFPSNGKEPFHTQSYSEKKFGHVERKYVSLGLFRSLCAY